MKPATTRYYGKAHRAMPVPDLATLQRHFYDAFLQADVPPGQRKNEGLEALFREFFPIESYDGKYVLEYLHYDLGVPRHTPEECRNLGLTHEASLRVKFRFVRPDGEPVEEYVYLGGMPLMIGGGEFIVNGAQRVIVAQLQRSPGVDFSVEAMESGRRLHSCRIIPERGSWLQVEITTRDACFIRIDRSGRIPATCFMRALSDKYASSTAILKAFYDTEKIPMQGGKGRKALEGAIVVADHVNKETGEVYAKAGGTLTAAVVDLLAAAGIKEVEILKDVKDDLIVRTLAEDETSNHTEALLFIYSMVRGSPVNLERAETYFNETFTDSRRFNFGPIGRFRINRKLNHGVSEGEMTLSAGDFLHILKYICALRAGKGAVDDIDHLSNRRVRTIADLLGDEFRKGLIKLRRSVRERMSLKDVEKANPRSLVNAQTVSSSVDYFFARGELSQVVDQANPLSQLTHERRLSALGPGGLNRKRAGFDVRDVHPSHYGRICPIETPEGANIGLIVSLSIYGKVNELGFLVSPYVKVRNGKVTDEVVYLRADEEVDYFIAQADIPVDSSGKLQRDKVMARYHEDFVEVPVEKVQIMDVAPAQLVGVSAALIPFLEHDDANRALMGSNMQRQAVPLLKPEAPIVSTGIEDEVAANSSMVVCAQNAGSVKFVDASRIVVKNDRSGEETAYELTKFRGLNDGTCLNQQPVVRPGDKVKKGQVIADGAATDNGVLALGSNCFVAFVSWEGLNFEDAVLVSERLVRDDRFTSIHIEEYQVEVRETKLGREEITRDIPNVSEAALANLDESGLVVVGTRVQPGDILVGKIAPKTKTELSSEEKLLYAIFGPAGEDVRNDSLKAKPGTTGYCIGVSHFKRVAPGDDEGRRSAMRQARKAEEDYRKRIAAVIRRKFAELEKIAGKRLVNKETGELYRVTDRDHDKDVIATDDAFAPERLDLPADKRRAVENESRTYLLKRRILEAERDRIVDKLRRGDDLPTGVLEMVKVYIAVKRKLSVGDKMAGRHGNKGVVSMILPVEDMPFLADGTPVDMILNPLGVPSRMNFGQILETHLGWAAGTLGVRAITPVFDGASDQDIRNAMKEAGLPEDGKVVLFDGRTGEPFHQKVTVGIMYMMKLNHLVAEKVHARATGPYSLITQQPLGGKARNGGQRFGEMEVWALEAYGAAHTLQEMLTVKSDDVEGRTKIYDSVANGEARLQPGMPASFEVLMNEVRGLALNMRLHRQVPAKALTRNKR
ncbi:MAG TPA: DNA-directed RNA polymerase subunit beta [Planctomycetes bacterium]|nr:DNA-directed RNA polymerase subunit beta [Planctomycetota bacterium]